MRGLMVVVAALASASALGEEGAADAGASGLALSDAGAAVQEARDAGAAVALPVVAPTPAPTPNVPTAAPVAPDTGVPSLPTGAAQAAAFVAVDGKHTSLTELAALRADGSMSLGSRSWVRGTLAMQVLPAFSAGSATGGYGLRDTGSTFALGLGAPDDPAGELSLTVAPFGTQRIRPTFDWADTWGRPLVSDLQAPIALATWRTRRFEVWAALRGGAGLDPAANQVELHWGGLVGVSASLGRGVTLEARGAAFDRGLNQALLAHDVSKRVTATGGTVRLGWSTGGGVDSQWDPIVYAADPELFERPLARGPELEPLAATVLLETGMATQELAVPGAPGEVKPVPGSFADLQARLRVGRLRLFATARARTLSLILFDGPGFPSYTATSATAVETPELSAFVGAEWRVAPWFTPSLLIRVQQPATMTTALPPGFISALPPDANTGPRTVVVAGLGRIAELNADTPVMPVAKVSFGARFDISTACAVLVNLDGTYDANNTPGQRVVDVGAPVPAGDPIFAVSGSATFVLRLR